MNFAEVAIMSSTVCNLPMHISPKSGPSGSSLGSPSQKSSCSAPTSLQRGLIAHSGGEWCLGALTLDKDRWVRSPFSCLALSTGWKRSIIICREVFRWVCWVSALNGLILCLYTSLPLFWVGRVTGSHTVWIVKPVHNTNCVFNQWLHYFGAGTAVFKHQSIHNAINTTK